MKEVESITQSKITFKNGAFIQALASDYAGAAGSNPTISVFDELWAFVSERSRRMFDELVVPPTRPLGCRLVTTYAGFEGESVLLESLYKRGLGGREIGPDLYATDDGLLMFWSHDPVAPWQTPEWIEQMRSSLRAGQFRRMIQNEWVASEESFVDLAWWDGCVDPSAHPIVADPSMAVWCGVDASVKHDCTAIVGCGWDQDQKRVRLVFHRVFRPSKADPLDFEATVEATLLELHEKFSLREVRYDPYQMAAVAQRLERRGLRMLEFPQSVPNLTAAGQNLYELIKGRGLLAYPDDEFRRAISQSVAIESSRGWRIGKTTGSHKVDLTVALAFACLGAVREGPSVPITPDMLQVIDDSTVSGQVLDLAARGYAPDEMRLEIEQPRAPWRFDDDDLPMAGPFVV
jgi:phage terminase large subunit-like protein